MSNYIHLFANTLPEAIINKKTYSTIPHKYWKLSQNHMKMITEATQKYYNPLNRFYGNICLVQILRVIGDMCKYVTTLTNLTPIMTNINKNVVLKKAFDEEITSFIYEYYLLCVFKNYMIMSDQNISYTDDYGLEINCDILSNKKSVSELFLVYIDMMYDSKKHVNISYESVSDEVFKNKEFEKNLVTDRLASMTQEERDIDTMLKGLKLGMYGIGESKALRFYDQDQFEEDKVRNEKISKLEKKSKTGNVDDADVQDDDYENEADRDEGEELTMNEDEDYQDGDPYGDERDDDNDYSY
jgi:hypothetical protein